MKCRIFTPKTANTFLVFTALSILLRLPTSACAQDDDGLAMLRRLGRTFAAVGEKASPAVVVLTVDVPNRQELERQPESGRLQQPEPQVEWWTPPSLRSDESRAIIRDNTPDLRLLQRRARVQPRRGLGFIISAEGHILTNHHIVAQAPRIKAKLADGREFEARIVGTDPTIDIAVLQIDAADLPVLELGDSEALSVGDWVIGMTNSMGAGLAFSAGMVTAKKRSMLGMAALEDYVQTDVVLHLGDGGGPLLDLDGRVVGINSAIVGREQGLAISLAIPVNMAKSAYEQIIKTGKVERGFLGVAFKEVTPELAKNLGLETTSGVIVSDVVSDSAASTTSGVIVSDVVSDSAASEAGIKKNDIIAEVNGVPIGSGPQLLLLVASLKPGAEVDVVVVREGKRQTLTVTLGERPSPETGTPEDK